MNGTRKAEFVDEIPIQYVKTVGEKRARALETVGIYTVEDLLEYRPRRYLDRSNVVPISQVKVDEEVTVTGEVIQVEVVRRGRRRLRVQIYDRTGVLEGIWFHQIEVFSRIFQVGMTVAFSGKVTRFKGWQMVHPDFDIISEKGAPIHTGQIIPLYPSGEALRKVGFSSYGIRRLVHLALERYQSAVPETLPTYLIERYRLLPRAMAYRQMHFPESETLLHQAYRRFKYEELFYMELLMALRKRVYQSPVTGLTMSIQNDVLKRIVDSLPFQLTGAQRRVLREIYQDLKSGHPMNRLLQGDVGSGKTVVALLTMLMAISAGYQAALMAPTEILAQQHYFSIKEMLKPFDVRVGLLIGSLKAAEKARMHQAIRQGEVDLVIGTHALIQEPVEFHRLGVVVIDEQHRFGVLQRAELIEKGQNPHVLVMTATPIPRTLALTLYGDLDVSIIDELPPGRQPITTVWRTEDRLPRIYDFIRERVKQGEQAYIVYPIIEESEKIDLKAATVAFENLQQKVFPEFKLALLHGRLKMEEKEHIMQQFKEGKIQILISTTVIEVGVDVPNATIMLIEHAERFGLSQLHQLRGRVGRGARKSYCILVTPAEISEVARQRMRAMEATTDGFKIAEEDLRLRGSGEFFGTRQHGLPDLRYADLVADAKIVEAARKDAFALIERDPHLRLAEHAIVRRQFMRKFADKFQMAHIA
ncbi:MAG: ATP-dependent DNA helicase RecG [Calditrichaeota bacterium]|nr:ATP-dependent DNA helicase RecG [Calditrichota bacterium]